jgi:hypothetical protein
MARLLVHGLVVETASDLGFDPAAELLAGYPAAPPGQGAGLRIAVAAGRGEGASPGAAAPTLAGPAAEVETILLQGTTRVFVSGGAVHVEAPGFTAQVPLAGDRVEAQVHDAGLDRRVLAEVDLFLAFAAALRLLGWYHLHAACTVAPGGAPVLIAGPGGSGKSTLCAALVTAGHRYLGDDVVFLDGARGRLLAFPRRFHLGPQAVQAIPGAAMHVTGRYSATEKQALDAGALFPGLADAEAGPPRVLLFPRVVGGVATTVEPLAPVEATAELIEASAFVAGRLPGHREHLSALAALADRAPAWRVAMSRDLLGDAAGTARNIARQVC